VPKGIHTAIIQWMITVPLILFLYPGIPGYAENQSSDGEILWNVRWKNGARDAIAVEGDPRNRWIVAGERGKRPYVAMYDYNGVLIWENTINMSRDARVAAIAEADGGFLLVGTISRADIFVAMIDTNGDLIWNRTIGADSRDWAQCMAVCRSGDFMIGGLTLGQGGKVSALVLKLNASGSELWRRKIFSSKEVNEVQSIEPVSDGFILVGMTNWKIFLAKMDEDGRIIWRRTPRVLGELSQGVSSILVQGPEDRYYVLGYHYSLGFYIKIWLFDADGKLIWTRPLGMGYPGQMNLRGDTLYISASQMTHALPDGYLVLWRVGPDGEILGRTIQEEVKGTSHRHLILDDGDVIIVGATLARLELKPCGDSWISSSSEGQTCYVFDEGEDIHIQGEGFEEATQLSLCMEHYRYWEEQMAMECRKIHSDDRGSIGTTAIGPLAASDFHYSCYRAWIDLDNDERWDLSEPYNIIGIPGSSRPQPLLIAIIVSVIICVNVASLVIMRSRARD